MNLIEKPLESLTPHPDNYNPHSDGQVGELTQSLDDFGQYKNIVVWRDPSDGKLYIIAGHGLWLAAKKRGDETIIVNDRSDLSREQAMALMAADNFTANDSGLYDFGALGELLGDLDDPLEIPGIDERELAMAGLLDMPTAEDLWQGMPEFEQEDLSPYRTIKVHFRSDEDASRFGELVGQSVTEKTKYLWYPKLIRERYGKVE